MRARRRSRWRRKLAASRPRGQQQARGTQRVRRKQQRRRPRRAPWTRLKRRSWALFWGTTSSTAGQRWVGGGGCCLPLHASAAWLAVSGWHCMGRHCWNYPQALRRGGAAASYRLLFLARMIYSPPSALPTHCRPGALRRRRVARLPAALHPRPAAHPAAAAGHSGVPLPGKRWPLRLRRGRSLVAAAAPVGLCQESLCGAG